MRTFNTGTAERKAGEKLLMALTALPTAAGHEDAAAAFLERWTDARKARLSLSRDRYGNILISRRGSAGKKGGKPPIFITAHIDHPAFVALTPPCGGTVTLEFRGGVHDPYFRNAEIEIFDRGLRRSFPARIVSLRSDDKPFKTVSARLRRQRAEGIGPGCVARWKFPAPSVSGGLLHTHACDDLGGAAAALQAYERISRERGLEHVSLLFTRAEEVGFIGAIGAARGGTVPKGARLICLECSRSYPHDSPIGAGPIVRVGDRLSVFTPELTNSISDIAEALSKADPGFRFQRKLMPGGACEATAFASYGLRAACLCLPLGNYHNMADIDGVAAGGKKARVARECISLSDFHGLVRLLTAVAEGLDRPSASWRDLMEKRWTERGYVLKG